MQLVRLVIVGAEVRDSARVTCRSTNGGLCFFARDRPRSMNVLATHRVHQGRNRIYLRGRVAKPSRSPRTLPVFSLIELHYRDSEFNPTKQASKVELRRIQGGRNPGLKDIFAAATYLTALESGLAQLQVSVSLKSNRGGHRMFSHA